jgi:8-oxo-dGTP pyrophosphatase MutT (NUDIX family)
MSDKANRNNPVDVPIQVIGRRLACENNRFLVYLDHVVDQTGFEVKNYLVISPKTSRDNLISGVAILPIVGKRVGLVRIYRPAIRAFSWEIPHGFVDQGESDEQSASRELLEETGLVVAPGGLKSLGYITPDSGILAARVHLYLAAECAPSVQKVSELGLRELRLFNIDDLKKMIGSSEIQDTFTLCALFRYHINSK